MKWSDWLQRAAPAPGPAALASAAGGLAFLGVLAGLGYGLSQTGAFAENFGFVVGLVVAPLCVGMLMAAALWEKRSVPRAGLWLLAALAVIVGGLFGALGLSASEDVQLDTAVFSYTCLCLPLGGLVSLPGLYFAFRAAPEMRAALNEERETRALQMLTARGEVTLAELAAELRLPVSACDDLVEQLLRQERFVGLFDAPRGRVYTHAALRAKQKQLVAVVQARGQVTFDDLAAELNAPRDLLRQWVYEVVKRGEFAGYLNWREGMLYSADAQKLRAGQRCPRCGGGLSLAGQGVVQCAHCGAEIFLS